MGLRRGAKEVLKKPKNWRSVKDVTELVKLSSSITRLPNNAINSDSEKHRAFVAMLFTAGYGER
jgi:hypothetical protein